MSLTGDCEGNQETCLFNHPKSKTPAQNVENVRNRFKETPSQEPPNLPPLEMTSMMELMIKTLKSDMTVMFKNMMSHW